MGTLRTTDPAPHRPTGSPGGRRPRRGLGAAAGLVPVLTLVVLAAGCATPRFDPDTPGMPPVCDPSPWVAEEIPRLRAPFDDPQDPGVEAARLSAVPHLLNLEEVQRAIVAEFMSIMMRRDEIPSGTVRHWLLVDAEGRVATIELDEGSGDAALDDAAGRVVRTLDLTPAVRDGCRVAVWVRYPIRFQAGDRLRTPDASGP